MLYFKCNECVFIRTVVKSHLILALSWCDLQMSVAGKNLKGRDFGGLVPPHSPIFGTMGVNILQILLCPRMRIHPAPPGQNDRHFADEIFKRIFLNENVKTISILFSLKFVPKGPIDNKSALVVVMACRLFGTMPLPEPMLTQFTDACMRH